jgi:hypothetical protein
MGVLFHRTEVSLARLAVRDWSEVSVPLVATNHYRLNGRSRTTGISRLRRYTGRLKMAREYSLFAQIHVRTICRLLRLWQIRIAMVRCPVTGRRDGPCLAGLFNTGFHANQARWVVERGRNNR